MPPYDNIPESNLMSVKVNVFVDKGVAPLVEAMSTHPRIVTTHSCETGTTNFGPEVSFVHQDGMQALFDTLQVLSSRLKTEIFSGWKLTLKWNPATSVPSATIAVNPEELARVIQVISRAFRESRDTSRIPPSNACESMAADVERSTHLRGVSDQSRPDTGSPSWVGARTGGQPSRTQRA